MTTLERKKYLKKKIDAENDGSVLRRVENIFQFIERAEIPEHVLKDIEIARNQYLKGEFLNEEEAEKKFDEWLSEK